MLVHQLAGRLREARDFQLALFADLEGPQLIGAFQHHIEPPLWEMGHVAWFQEFWILRELDGAAPLEPRYDGIYDAFNVSYKRRCEHDYPSREATLAYAEAVLERCEARLDGRAPTAEERYFYELAAQHEGMHTENLLGVRQSRAYARPPLAEAEPPEVESGYEAHDVEVPGGTYRRGAPRDAEFVFDNEKWAHEVELESYRISSTPVTNEAFARFVDAGGYTTRAYWDKHGWEWRRRGGYEAPLYWKKRAGLWHERRFDRWEPLRARHPLCHVGWHEAKAYCRFADRRLPTEAEWEVAASYDPATRTQSPFPWGTTPPEAYLANLGFDRTETVDVAAFPAGDSPLGCRQMIGNVWEWTSSILQPYPGFELDPYDTYSEPYFGKKPVLRGGCFATPRGLIRNTWRNFFIRHRRNIFAGFRTCAR